MPWTAVRQVRYTILEFNSNPSATNAILLRAEDGVCPLDTSGPTLKRSDATTVVYSSWDGTNLYPKMGSSTAASKQSFSTSSGNIRIICSAAAEDNPFVSPIIASSIGTAINYGRGPFTAGNSGTLTLTCGTTYYFPVVMVDFGLYSTISMYFFSFSGTAHGFYGAIYEVSKTGIPGRQLANFGNFAPGSSLTVGTSAALATPVFLDPGWYWLACLPTATTTGSITVSGLQGISGGPVGTTFRGDNANTVSFSVASQTPPLPDPAVAPTTAVGTVGVNYIPAFGLQ